MKISKIITSIALIVMTVIIDELTAMHLQYNCSFLFQKLIFQYNRISYKQRVAWLQNMAILGSYYQYLDTTDPRILIAITHDVV